MLFVSGRLKAEWQIDAPLFTRSMDGRTSSTLIFDLVYKVRHHFEVYSAWEPIVVSLSDSLTGS